MGPDFIGIGLQKSGSTFLYQALAAHPGITFPATAQRLGRAAPVIDGVTVNTLPKEVHFLKGRNEAIGWPAYLSLFPKSAGISGEITPLYATAGRDRIAQLRQYCPDIRVFALLRHPVERDWSAIRMIAKRQGVLAADEALLRIADLPQVQQMGNYLPQLRTWSQALPTEQLQFFSQAQLAKEPAQVIAAVVRHIGADPVLLPPPPPPAHIGPQRACPAVLRDRLVERHAPRLEGIADLTGIQFHNQTTI
ncbi:hypothetical protein [Halovulum sp. GXIMD14793]